MLTAHMVHIRVACMTCMVDAHSEANASANTIAVAMVVAVGLIYHLDARLPAALSVHNYTMSVCPGSGSAEDTAGVG